MPGGNGGPGGLGGLAGPTGPQWFRNPIGYPSGSFALNCQFSLISFLNSYSFITPLQCANNCLSTSGCTHVTYSILKCYIYSGVVTQSMATYNLLFLTSCSILGKLFYHNISYLNLNYFI